MRKRLNVLTFVIGLGFLLFTGFQPQKVLAQSPSSGGTIISSEVGDICASGEAVEFTTKFWGTERDNWHLYPGNSTFGGAWNATAGSSIWIEVFGYTPHPTRIENVGILVVGVPVNEGFPEMRYLATSGVASTLTYTFPQDDIFDLWVLSDPERDSGVPLRVRVGCGEPDFTPGDPARGIAHNRDWTPLIQVFNDVEMVLVPAGCLYLRRPAATVSQKEFCFEEPYWIDRMEVSAEQFRVYLPEILGAFYPITEGVSPDLLIGQIEPLLFDPRTSVTPNLPIDSVNWEQAKAYCEARGARLPTEVEWEYAGRGPDGLIYPWGNNQNPDIWASQATYKSQPVPVDSFPEGASWVGALNMIGNVEEYTSTIADPFSFNYPYNPDDGREDLTVVRDRIVRGGGVSNVTNFDLTRPTQLKQNALFDEVRDVGIRCAMDADLATIQLPSAQSDAQPTATVGADATLAPTDASGDAPTASPTPTTTASPTLVPSPTVTIQATPTPAACPGNPPPVLIVGESARVTPGNGNRMREEPVTTSTQVGRIPGGDRFTVVGGPECGEGYTWWQVEYQGIIGWTADDGTWLLPES